MCDAFLATWKLKENSKDDFDAYMGALGVNMVTRKAACALKPDCTISQNGDTITIKSVSTFKNSECSFKIGEEFDETTADGRKTKTTVTLDHGVLSQKQKWDGKETTITREVKDGEMIVTCIMGDVKCVRIYTKK